MAWGYAGKGASIVRNAFWEGRTRKVGNARTDGLVYYLFDNAIARRLPGATPLHELVIAKLEGVTLKPDFEFRFAGWPTTTTCSHLEVFGLSASIRQSTPRINGRIVDVYTWYTEKTLEYCPTETDEEAAMRRRIEIRNEKRDERTRIYNLTPQLEFA